MQLPEKPQRTPLASVCSMLGLAMGVNPRKLDYWQLTILPA